MIEFIIANKTIEFDDSKTYFDFFLESGKQKLVKIDFAALLRELAQERMTVDEQLTNYLRYLERWVIDAPRKLGYRKMRKDGFHVLTEEQFFDGDGGEEIIYNLENTGKLAEEIICRLGLSGKKWYSEK